MILPIIIKMDMEIIPAERFYYNWTMYDFFEKNYNIDERDHLFIAVEPE